MAELPNVKVLKTAPGRVPVVTSIKTKQAGLTAQLVCFCVTSKAETPKRA